ncbi:hypothetical protein Lalb_Chr24g0396871 [Lupinus albus]|uniref:Uncharacterized protein n=1 Tax=Lupinus albus TaxID=3870 RepID=A0A6A4NB48_LUPAL|nr:hypothetical protein Lalb_Chr24g0396871 [Lupinus albus]
MLDLSIILATTMSLTGNETLYMTLEPKQTCHFCNLRNQVSAIYSKVKDSDSSDKDKSYYAPFHLLGLANEFLAFWLFLVASSCFFWSKNLNSFGNCRIKAAEEVSLPDKIISNARANIENNATSHKYDAYSEISYSDNTTSYFDSLLSIELEEDTKWLSDSMSYELCSLEDPSTPLSCKYDSFSSDIESPNYWDSLLGFEEKESVRKSYFDSLLSLEDEDTRWLSFEHSSTPLSQKCDSSPEISYIGSPNYWDSLLGLKEKESIRKSYFDSSLEMSDIWSSNYWNYLLGLEEKENVTESYVDSLLSLEDKDTECLLFDDLSTPLSQKCDSLPEISDIGSPNYLDSLLGLEKKESVRESYFDSLLSLEDKDTKWLSFEDPSTSLSQKCDSLSEISYIGSPNYWDSLLGLEEEESDRENYFDSLLSLEDEDNEWLLFNDTSTPLSRKCDSLSELDIGSPSYWDSLLGLEEKDNEYGNLVALSSVSSVPSLITTVQTEEFFGDEPLFWPFEEKLNWNYEKSWTSFCSSPRKRIVFEAKKKSDEPSNFNDLPLGLEYLAMVQELPIETLLGLKEFDGYEGFGSEFNGDNIFMLDQSLQ